MNESEIIKKVDSLSKQVDSLSRDISKLKSRGVEITKVKKTRLTTSEAAEFLGISVKGLQKLTMERKIPFSKPNGKIIYFDPDELTQWMSRNRHVPEYEAGR